MSSMSAPQDRESLTEKQSAILDAFDEDPSRTYKEIADVAADKLSEGESVSSYYASRQIKERRPDHFDDEGDRLDPGATGTGASDDTSSSEGELAEEYGITENQARILARAEEESDLSLGDSIEEQSVSVELSQSEWLKIIGMLYQFSDSEEGELYGSEVVKIAGKISTQAMAG